MPHINPQAPHQPAGAYFTVRQDSGAANRWASNPRLTGGLCLLLDGYLYAHELGQDRWEFALEMEFLHMAGLNNNDLRWLVGKGYVDHGLKTKTKSKGRRPSSRTGRLALPKGSCFVLTDAGVQFAQDALASPEKDTPKREPELPSPDVPHWDAETHSLHWRGQLIKHFKHEAPFQEATLEAFEANNWPRYVVVTLPKEEGMNHKERLRETIKNLNRSCTKRLHFTQEGNGGRVGWQPLD